MVSFLYTLRKVMIFFWIFLALLSLPFRTPNDRWFVMFLDLQLMVNFALIQVTLPGNVEIASQVFKPLVSWSFIDVKGLFLAN